ncbi:MAG TPA: amylo-alpha-1,6-glucosidase [Roseiflexaceae bacterium]|jgi:hypothetical protein|nr:amylo-alpha-1,6-glucosidase [Roseiflexaceae bacterium]
MFISQRTLRFGPYTISSADTNSDVVPYFLAGRNMYNVGMVTGDFQPIGAEHLVGEMGGIWAHPIKVADGLTLLISDSDGQQPMAHGFEVIELLSHIEWRYRLGGMEVRRRDFIAEDHAAFFSLLTLRNAGGRPKTGRLHLRAWLKFLGCWFGGMTTGGGEYWLEDTAVLGYDRKWQGRWGVAVGTTVAPERCSIEERPVGRLAQLDYPFTLPPGATRTWEFVLTADHERGHEGAHHLFSQLAGSGEQLLQEKVERYHERVFRGVALETPDKAVNRAFALAKANLHLLSADYGPSLPPYFLAGVPEYPQLFGCDTEYTVPGATAAGFATTSKSALLALADYGGRACGRVPHEVTTNGRVFHPGNTQETPQFVAACWDYFRWTGDFALLGRVYPLCKEGIDDYMPAIWGGAGSAYPIGDGVVERGGMGDRKLDSVCYLFQALESLAHMAEALEFADDAARYTAHYVELRRRFEQDWWIEDEQVYADSMSFDEKPQLDGYWTVVLPLQLGMTSPERARQSLERIKREWVNEWGLVHTRDREELVWTLPTGLLALTAFRYNQPDLGVRLLQNIAETAHHGTLGAFKELIPIGLCFVQLWSAGLYTQGIIEGLLGLQPLAHLHRLSINAQLPQHWPGVRLSALKVGAHELSLQITPTGIDVHHLSGPERLDIRYHVPDTSGPLQHDIAFGPEPQVMEEEGLRWLQIALMPEQRVVVDAMPEGITVHIPDRREERARQDEP